MQIHELNTYTGNLDASAYFAIDNGTDTGRVSAETLLNASKDYVTPEMFGAKGDGVTDDTTAIQSAINFLIGNNGGILFLPKGQYLIGDLIIRDCGFPISIIGSGTSLNCCSLLYKGNDYALNIHGVTHLTIKDFAIYPQGNMATLDTGKGAEFGAIRFYDMDEALESGYTDSRSNDCTIENILISKFRVGITIDCPVGYIRFRHCFIDNILSNGYAIRIGKKYNRSYYDSHRYTVNPNYIYIDSVYTGGLDVSSASEYQPTALIGIYRGSHIDIANSDLCNLAASPCVHIDDSNYFVREVTVHDTAFYNVKYGLSVEMPNNDANRTVFAIKSANNLYFAGNYENARGISVKGNSSRVVQGFSSVDDLFVANASNYIQYMMYLDYVRNVSIVGANLLPNSDYTDFWGYKRYSITNCTNIEGTKALRLRVNGTTDNTGRIEVAVPTIWNNIPFILTNIKDASSTPYNCAISAYNTANANILVRFRANDGSAITNKVIDMYALVIGD